MNIFYREKIFRNILSFAGMLSFSPCFAYEAMGQGSFGLALGQANISSSGYYTGSISASPFLRFELDYGISKHSSVVITNETASNIYINSSGALRYYPWSLANRKTQDSELYQLTYDDNLRPYVGLGLSLGRLRLETKDQLGATEVTASFYGFDMNIGVLGRVIDRWSLSFEAGFSMLLATADSSVEFNGSRTRISVGIAFQP